MKIFSVSLVACALVAQVLHIEAAAVNQEAVLKLLDSLISKEQMEEGLKMDMFEDVSIENEEIEMEDADFPQMQSNGCSKRWSNRIKQLPSRWSKYLEENVTVDINCKGSCTRVTIETAVNYYTRSYNRKYNIVADFELCARGKSNIIINVYISPKRNYYGRNFFMLIV